MIFADIRVQFVAALLGLLVMCLLILPDRYGQRVNGVCRMVALVPGLLALFLVFGETPPHAVDMVLGTVSENNFWGGLLAHRDDMGLFPAVVLAGYFLVGLIWTTAHFWLYARRLGQMYVLERNGWLSAHGFKDLSSLSAEARSDFQEVLLTVKKSMVYEGDFPLQVLQQKRFFIGNLMLWPVTLVSYLLGNLAVDIARYIWFALRDYVQCKWEAHMALYLADEARCLEIERAEKSPAIAKG